MAWWPKSCLVTLMLYCWGFTSIRTKNFEVSDYWTDYDTSAKRAGLIISNHVSILDMFLYVTIWQNPSFLSKIEVGRIPIIGLISRVH